MPERYAAELRIALEIAARGAEHQLRMHREGFEVREKSSKDLVTDMDAAIEREMVTRLREAFPRDRVIGEETGMTGPDGAGRAWVLDPIDGTNNIALGIPYFGASVALLDAGDPVVGVVTEPARGRTFWAVRGQGAYRNGQRLAVGQPPDLSRAVVAWIQGHALLRSAAADRLLLDLDRNCRRILRTWAPALNWCYAAEGRIDALVALETETEDLFAGRLIFEETGGSVVKFGRPESFVAARAPLAAELSRHVIRMLGAPISAGFEELAP